MKVAVLGATGPSGRQVVLQSLDKGWTVKALVRNPDGLKDIENPNLEVVKCDIFSEDSMAMPLIGCDSVLCCLGANLSWPWSTITLHSESIKHILAAMRRAAVTRFVVITASCTKKSPNNPKLMEWFFKPLVIGPLMADMARMEDYLRSEECSDINFTIVKPNGLNNKPLLDVELKVEESECVAGGALAIPRANVAKFMIDALETEKWNRKAVAIAV